MAEGDTLFLTETPDGFALTPYDEAFAAALAAFAAANIGGTDPNRTGWAAARIGWSAYIVPFLFVFSPTLLMVGSPLDIAVAAVTAGLGVWLGSIGVTGYFLRAVSLPARLGFFACGILALIPAGYAFITGIVGNKNSNPFAIRSALRA